jgi:hypothetical protein
LAIKVIFIRLWSRSLILFSKTYTGGVRLKVRTRVIISSYRTHLKYPKLEQFDP